MLSGIPTIEQPVSTASWFPERRRTIVCFRQDQPPLEQARLGLQAAAVHRSSDSCSCVDEGLAFRAPVSQDAAPLVPAGDSPGHLLTPLMARIWHAGELGSVSPRQTSSSPPSYEPSCPSPGAGPACTTCANNMAATRSTCSPSCAGGHVVALKAKATASPARDDARHLRWLRDRLQDLFAASIVLHFDARLRTRRGLGRDPFPSSAERSAAPSI